MEQGKEELEKERRHHCICTAGRGISIMYPHDSTDNVFNSISDDSHHEDIDEHGLFYHNYDAAIFAWGWPAGSEVTGTR